MSGSLHDKPVVGSPADKSSVYMNEKPVGIGRTSSPAHSRQASQVTDYDNEPDDRAQLPKSVPVAVLEYQKLPW